MTFEEAVLALRKRPDMAALLRDTFLDGDLEAGARRFAESEEFRESLLLLGPVDGLVVADLGAGTGIASWAFAAAGADKVYAIEPDSSDVVGRGAIASITAGQRVEIVEGWGESLPIRDSSVDVVYARQVLHLEKHPLHQLTGNEGAFSIAEYRAAFENAGLQLIRQLGPLDSVINAYPTYSKRDLKRLPSLCLAKRFGVFGYVAGCIWPIGWYVRRRKCAVAEAVPGRVYSFLAKKPMQ